MRLLLTAAILAFAAGCSAIYQVDEASRPASPAELDAWVTAWYEAALAARTACGGTTIDDARSRWLGPRASHTARAQALLARGQVRFDRALGQACLEDLATAAGRCAQLDTLLDDPAGPCQGALHGVVPEGGACLSDRECGPGAWCDPSGACPGRCTRLAALGEACSATRPCGYRGACHCGYGTPPCNEPVCHLAWRLEGDACSSGGGAPCGPGTFCRGPDMICTALLGSMAACGLGDNACQPDLRCTDGTSGFTCTGRTPTGWRCVPGVRQCAPGAWCDDSNPADPSCRAFPGVGGACGAPPSGAYETIGCLDADCVIPAGATAGTCRVRAAYGEACSAGQRCTPFSPGVACNAATGRCEETCPGVAP